jgi:hypothetical protein
MVRMVRASPVLVPKAVWPEEPPPPPKALPRPPPWGFWMRTVSTSTTLMAMKRTMTIERSQIGQAGMGSVIRAPPGLAGGGGRV